MISESLEGLRRRLLREQRVQQMIRARAYEIYEMRGNQPGGDAHDWFQAESEVLAFLIANESHQADENEKEADKPEVAATISDSERSRSRPAARESKPSKKTATKSASSKKPAQPKPKSKRTRKKATTEENGR
jgi:DUF2934 family protein